MAAFPHLTTGAVAQYPSSRQVGYATEVVSYIDGTEQRYRKHGKPIERWRIVLTNISMAELAAIEQFFGQHQGQFGSFSFVDPWTGIEHDDCSFDQDEFGPVYYGHDRAGAHIIIRNNRV